MSFVAVAAVVGGWLDAAVDTVAAVVGFFAAVAVAVTSSFVVELAAVAQASSVAKSLRQTDAFGLAEMHLTRIDAFPAFAVANVAAPKTSTFAFVSVEGVVVAVKCLKAAVVAPGPAPALAAYGLQTDVAASGSCEPMAVHSRKSTTFQVLM